MVDGAGAGRDVSAASLATVAVASSYARVEAPHWSAGADAVSGVSFVRVVPGVACVLGASPFELGDVGAGVDGADSAGSHMRSDHRARLVRLDDPKRDRLVFLP